jgi:preflagellin peptidase FlaK
MAIEGAESLALINAAAVFTALLYSSYKDLLERLVDDWVWLATASVTTPITAYQLLIGALSPPLTAISLGVTAIMSYLFYKLGLYGGADAKALMVIGLSTPLSSFGLRYHPFTPVTVLLNSLLLSLAIPLTMLLINLYRIFVRGERLFAELKEERLYRKVLAVFLGTVLNEPRRYRFWAPMEEYRNGWVLRLSPKIEDFWSTPRPGGWATPSIPLIIFITIGAALNYMVGDLSALFLAALFS